MFKSWMRLILLAVCATIFPLTGPLVAGPSLLDAKAVPASEDATTAFMRGTMELQIAAGPEISIQNTSELRPNIDYALAVVRFGYVFDAVRGTGVLRGNDEVMIEAIGGPIYTGPGSALGGLTVIYRRNFIPRSERIVPYLDLGAGGIYSDAYHEHTERALGSPFEFDLHVGVGVRYRLDPHWSLDGEVSFRHLSNADFAPRNYGTNALGGLVGVSYSF